MTTDWSKVKHFKPSEFTYPDQFDPLLIYSIDALRDAAGRSIKINSDYRPGDPGQHGLGRAVDIVISGLHVVDQFLLAEKTRLFAGIGIYPHWNRPGIHVDIRTLQPHEPGARWARDIAGNYVALTWAFMRGLK
jgi:uncharacterized protein YcbK (DUF882 family)